MSFRAKAKAVRCKLGTQPAMLQFRYAYKLRPGLAVQFRTIENGKWLTGIVRRIDPMPFVDLW